jgi:release factor glutamine methyltransferase
LFGGGDDGLEAPLVFLAAAVRLLRPGGVLVMEHDPSQATALRVAAAAAGFEAAITGRDLTGRDRYLRAVRAAS